MSYFEFNVKDYRILKDANIEPEGVTLIYGRNGSGKSSLIKSLVTLLSNKHSEDNFRHGKDSYSISARCGENTVTYSRSGSNAQVQFNDETPKTKLGKGTLYDLEPRFPLRRVDFIEENFYPNFSFQNSVPVFEDISVENLFSVMFSDVAKVSDRVSQLKKDITNTSKIKNDSQVGSDMLKEKVSETSKKVDKIKSEHPDLEEQYDYLRGLAIKQSNLAKFQAEYTELSAQCSDPTKRTLVSLYNEAQPLFADLVFVDKVKSTLSQLDKALKSFTDCTTELSKLTNLFPVNVVTLISGINQIFTCQSSLESVHKSLFALPDVHAGLVSTGSAIINLQKTLERVLLELQSIPVVDNTLISEVGKLKRLKQEHLRVSNDFYTTDLQYGEIMSKLRVFPCERLVIGTCPYQDQIKVGM